MQLISVDKQTTIEISQASSGGVHAPYKLRVRGRGGFFGENDSVHFLNIEGLRAAMEAFLKKRQGSVILLASDDCEFEFFRWNARGDIGVRYVIGTQFMEGEATERSKMAVSGKFKLHGEFAERMATQLLETLHA